MKKLIALLSLVISTSAFSAQRLKCVSDQGLYLVGVLSGYQLTHLHFFNNVAETDFEMSTVTYKKQMDMYKSSRFNPIMPYPQYSLKYNMLLSLPGDDMREGSFVALLIENSSTKSRETELNCKTSTL